MTRLDVLMERIEGPIDQLAHELAIEVWKLVTEIVLGDTTNNLSKTLGDDDEGDWAKVYAPALRHKTFKLLAQRCAGQAEGWEIILGKGLGLPNG